MNLPLITAAIGAQFRDDIDVLDSRIKSIKLEEDEKDRAYNIFMTFNLDEDKLLFDDPLLYNERHTREFKYFGNNSGSSLQTYVVREVKVLYYLLAEVWMDLYKALEKENMNNSELYQLLKELEENKFVFLKEKKGKMCINFKKLILPQDIEIEIKSDDKKKILVKDKKDEKDQTMNYENFIKYIRGEGKSKYKYVLVVPRIIKDGNEIIVSKHPDYIELIKRLNKIGEGTSDNSIETVETAQKRVCYICGNSKVGASSSKTSKFSRSGINKFFTITTKNSARFLESTIDNYDDVYSFCDECYQNLLIGEKVIEEKFKGNIAGESAYILPESMMGEFNFNYISKIKEHVDFAFNVNDSLNWLKSVEAEAIIDQKNPYVVNFIIYRTDGRSVELLDAFEDIPFSRFVKLNELFKEKVKKIKPHLEYFSLSSIYHIIPVRKVKVNQKEKQIDIGRVLTLYKSILSDYQVERETIYSYASEALDKGIWQLSKGKIDNYENLQLTKYIGKTDFFIKTIIMSYIVLMKVLQELKIVDKYFFKNRQFWEGEKLMDEKKEFLLAQVEQIEVFLEQQGFTDEEKALFYLGTLLYRVALAQFIKEHKTKPILKKIQFQGMNINEVLRLYEDIIEKLRQYDKMTLFAENLINRFHNYFGPLRKRWPLSDQANVFYIMAGYAYMVGQKTPDITKEEESAVEKEKIAMAELEKLSE
ncbi:CRISPR-associated protein Cas8b/Csh1 [Thermoanaerobacter sp. YS13]|uniref:TM1802 family CRISPR-associated protein n=1 Tax=Thermoanaerobacter sp. YS13 TaxID=1511746 RepID=UPI000574323D|nr:TM1802 family CRISPR-associated protein [Thermoanaerobacter sp. YS13]KHO61705.1 CRISPR-associated protein Cas8b/Csh1 [Thermoanaerobacter sp. YS13]